MTIYDDDGNIIEEIPMTAADDDWMRAGRIIAYYQLYANKYLLYFPKEKDHRRLIEDDRARYEED